MILIWIDEILFVRWKSLPIVDSKLMYRPDALFSGTVPHAWFSLKTLVTIMLSAFWKSTGTNIVLLMMTSKVSHCQWFRCCIVKMCQNACIIVWLWNSSFLYHFYLLIFISCLVPHLAASLYFIPGSLFALMCLILLCLFA